MAQGNRSYPTWCTVGLSSPGKNFSNNDISYTFTVDVFGLRRLYGELAETWHGRAGSPAGLKITNMGPRRSFPAPSPILHGEIQEKATTG